MRMLVFLTCLILTSISAQALAPSFRYYPDEFYAAIESGLRDGPLRERLFEALSRAHLHQPQGGDRLTDSCRGQRGCYRHANLGYTGARKILFGELHLLRLAGGYAIKDVYCDKTATARDFKANPPGPGQIPDASVLNTEHTWPQSRFSHDFDTGLQKSDLHILFPVLARANSSRSNIEFGEVVTATSAPCPKAKRGYTARGGTQSFFETPDGHKGNVARALFYFSVRYRLPISELEEETLRRWHRLDPADQAEVERGEAIFAKQKVRNPFIDHAELVEMIRDF